MTEAPTEDIKYSFHIKDLFKQSYFVSQGQPSLQHQLFEWLARENIVTQSDFKAHGENPIWLDEIYAPPRHSPTGQKDFGTEAKNDSKEQWQEFGKKVREVTINKSSDDEELLNRILNSLLTNDLYYQISIRPGRSISAGFAYDGNNDPHKSSLRHYVLNENFFAEPFTTLYKNLNPILKNIKPSSDSETEKIQIPKPGDSRREIFLWASNDLNMNQKLGILVKLWEQNHPGEKFFD